MGADFSIHRINSTALTSMCELSIISRAVNFTILFEYISLSFRFLKVFDLFVSALRHSSPS